MRILRWLGVLLAILAIAAAMAWTQLETLGRRLAKTAWAESWKTRADRERWELDRAEYERSRDRETRQVPVTPCAALADSAGPAVCLERVSAASVLLGEPVRLRLRWRDLPDDAYIRLWVDNAAPLGTRFRYAGPSGAITSRSFGGRPAGDEIVTWDGKGIYCAPADAPMMCDMGNVGRFALHAMIMGGSDPFWPSWPPMKPVPVHRFAQSRAPEVEFTGLPAPISPPRYGDELMGYVSKALAARLPKDGVPANYYDYRLARKWTPWRESWRSYCSDLDLAPPLEGRVTACFPKNRRDGFGIALRPSDITISGGIRTARGLLPAGEAKSLAEQAAFAFIKQQVDFDHYPEESELKRFGPRPDDIDPREFPDGILIGGQHLRRAEHEPEWEFRQRAQKLWAGRIRYAARNDTQPQFMGDGSSSFWFVTVRQFPMDLSGTHRGGEKEYSFRVDHDRRICLLGIWDRSMPPTERVDWSMNFRLKPDPLQNPRLRCPGGRVAS